MSCDEAHTIIDGTKEIIIQFEALGLPGDQALSTQEAIEAAASALDSKEDAQAAAAQAIAALSTKANKAGDTFDGPVIVKTVSSTPSLTLEPANANERVSLQMTPEWQIGTDSAFNGSRTDWYLYHLPSGQLPLRFDENGRGYVRWDWDEDLTGSDYEKAGWALAVNSVVGRNSDDTSGTVTVLQAILEVGAVGASDEGRSEFTPFYVMMSPDKAGPFLSNPQWWGTDINMLTHPSTGDPDDAPGFVVGLSMRVHHNSETNEIGPGWAGAFGGSIVARPLIGIEASLEGREDDRTFPLTAMLSLCGYSGQNDNGVDPVIYSGWDVAADFAADIGLRVGGRGGHAYLAHDARSKFKAAIQVNDFTENGIHVTEPHPDFEGVGLRVDPGCGPITVGAVDGDASSLAVNGLLHVGYAEGGSANIKLYSPEDTLRTTINMAGVFAWGTDVGGAEDPNLYGYHSASGRNVFFVFANGDTLINSQVLVKSDGHITIPNDLTVAADNTAAASAGVPYRGLYRDTDGFVKLRTV